MTKITVTADLKQQLLNHKEPLTLCDESGRILGRFIPVGDVPADLDLSKWVPVTPDISEEELERRQQEKSKGHTTTEVIEYLENL